MREVRYLKIPDPVAIFAYDPSTEKVLCTFYFGNRLPRHIDDPIDEPEFPSGVITCKCKSKTGMMHCPRPEFRVSGGASGRR
jgi:hypothetical protein